MFDKFSGECYVIPIMADEFDSSPMGKRFAVRMRTPKEFFDFDSTDKYPYQYMGEVCITTMTVIIIIIIIIIMIIIIIIVITIIVMVVY